MEGRGGGAMRGWEGLGRVWELELKKGISMMRVRPFRL